MRMPLSTLSKYGMIARDKYWRPGQKLPDKERMLQDTLQMMGLLAPDLLEELSKRAWILERIAALQPIGRRALASRLHLPEREVRAVAAALREAGYIELDAAGMSVSPSANKVLKAACSISHTVRGLSELENTLTHLLGVSRVMIVPGDADSDAQVLREVGRMAALKLRSLLSSGAVLAVSGGSTVAQVAANLQAGMLPLDVLVLPARGGMGRAMEAQADTLAAEFARRLRGHHRLLHLPDHLNPDAWHELQKMPEVRETIDALHRADVLVHGIGRADEMLKHRGLPHEVAEHILAEGAVAEALGHYFDAQGRVVYAASAVGLDGQAVERVPNILAVAAGAGKAEAILAVIRRRPHILLVTDEAAAQKMLEIKRMHARSVDISDAT